LQQLGFNISTLGGRLRTADSRGENVLRPFNDGRLWVPKLYDERELTLPMWVVGAEPDGSIPIDGDRQRQLRENVRALRQLFSLDGGLKLLQVDDPELGVLEAWAEARNVLDFSTEAGATRAVFAPTLYLPGVYLATQDEQGETGSAVPRADNDTWAFTVNGDVAADDHLSIIFQATTASSTLPRLTVQGTGEWVETEHVFADDEVMLIDVGAWRAYDPASQAVRTNTLRWSGRRFLQIPRGAQTLRFDIITPGGSGSFNVKVTYRPRYW
jgi:hypothetical protein